MTKTAVEPGRTSTSFEAVCGLVGLFLVLLLVVAVVGAWLEQRESNLLVGGEQEAICNEQQLPTAGAPCGSELLGTSYLLVDSPQFSTKGKVPLPTASLPI
jgi:hypothetical protein